MSTNIKGGEFLVKETLAEDVFIPEEFNEEQQMMAQTCRDFVDTQVISCSIRFMNIMNW